MKEDKAQSTSTCLLHQGSKSVVSSLVLYQLFLFLYHWAQTSSQGSPSDLQSVISHSLILILSLPRGTQTGSGSKIQSSEIALLSHTQFAGWLSSLYVTVLYLMK